MSIAETWLFIQRNPFVATATVSLFIASFSWFLTIRLKDRKALHYKLHVSRAMSIDRSVRHGLQILFNGVEVAELWIVRIVVINPANSPIVKSDVLRELVFRFGDSCDVLHCEKLSSVDDLISVEPESEGSDVKLKVTLINPRERHEIMVIVNQRPEIELVQGRVVGVTEVKKIISERWQENPLVLAMAAILVLLTMVALSGGALFWLVFPMCLLFAVAGILGARQERDGGAY